MKKLNLGLLAMTGLLLSHSANAITVTGNATAIIKRNITATETQQMNFGTISTSGTAGTVTLSRPEPEVRHLLTMAHPKPEFSPSPANRPPH